MIVSPLRIYVGASWKGDLENEKNEFEELIKSDLLMAPIYPREASTKDVTTDYFKKMNECDLVVVILGSMYSSHVNNEINYAFRNDIPVLCFVKDCDKDKELSEEIINLQTKRIVTMQFKTIEELKKEAKEAIINLLSEKFKDHKEIEKSILKLISDGRIEIIKPKPLQSEYIDIPRINPFERQ
jgi:nucleoside 2-deoxyribosyltransferase